MTKVLDLKKTSHSTNCNIWKNLNAKSVNIKLKEHRENQHKPTIFACNERDFNTVHSNQLEKHSRNVHEKSELACDTCTYNATHDPDLKRHQYRILHL